MARYIDAHRVENLLTMCGNYHGVIWLESVKSILHDVPTADVRENVHAVWEKKWHPLYKTELPCCPICNLFSVMRWSFCPNCGADMREGSANE